jgi:hypothetical protein
MLNMKRYKTKIKKVSATAEGLIGSEKSLNELVEKIGPDNQCGESLQPKTCRKIVSDKISGRGYIRLQQKAPETLGSKNGRAVELIVGDGTLTVIPATNRPSAYRKLLNLAAQVLTSEESAARWLHAPHFGLGGIRPIDHMRSLKGAQDVENILWSIEYGGGA